MSAKSPVWTAAVATMVAAEVQSLQREGAYLGMHAKSDRMSWVSRDDGFLECVARVPQHTRTHCEQQRRQRQQADLSVECNQIVAFGDIVLNGVDLCGSEFLFVLPPELLGIGALQTAGLTLKKMHDPIQIANRRSVYICLVLLCLSFILQ